MFGKKSTAFPTQAGAAIRSAEQAFGVTRQVTNDALDGLGESVHQLRVNTAPVLDRFSDQAQTLARQGLDAVRAQSLHLQAQARRTSEDTRHYIRDEPVRAMLIAATAGAMLMALAGLLLRPQRGR